MPQIAELYKDMSYGPAPEDDSAAIAWLESQRHPYSSYKSHSKSCSINIAHCIMTIMSDLQAHPRVCQGTACKAQK